MNKRGRILRILGLLLLAAALGLTWYNLKDDARAGNAAGERVEALREEITSLGMGHYDEPFADQRPFYQRYPDVEMPTMELNGVKYIGVLDIPDIGLSLPVASEWNYTNLNSSACRYVGSAYDGTLVICAHNFSTHFGPLRDLPLETELYFTDCDGNLFHYRTVEMQILQPMESEAMKNGDWDLTLFTCTIGGASRVTVRCELIDQLPAVYSF